MKQIVIKLPEDIETSDEINLQLEEISRSLAQRQVQTGKMFYVGIGEDGKLSIKTDTMTPRLGSMIDGTPDTLTLCGTLLSNNNQASEDTNK